MGAKSPMGTAKVGEDPGATEMPSAVRPPTVAAGALLLGAGGARPGPQMCPASASRRPTAAARFRCVFVCSLCGGSRSLLACFVSRMNLETKRRPLGLGRHDNCISDSQLLELSSRPPSPWLPTKERRPPPPGRGERRGGTGGSEGRAGGRWGEVRPSGAGREGARGHGNLDDRQAWAWPRTPQRWTVALATSDHLREPNGRMGRSEEPPDINPNCPLQSSSLIPPR